MIKLSKFKINPANPRIIKDAKYRKLVQSIKDFPEMLEKRPMVVVTDTDGIMMPIGGNMRLKALKEIYTEISESWFILADEWTEEQRKEFTIKDNVGFGEWDIEELQGWNADDLERWGLDMPETQGVDANDLFDIELPFYVPSDIKPTVSELANTDKRNELLAKIDNLKINDDLKDLLKIRSSFFTDFNFQKIADYFYNEDKEVQEVFKDLGLVILAPKEALERGFVELKEDLFSL